jgi:membrane protein YdbS with pleckstrin-like domain
MSSSPRSEKLVCPTCFVKMNSTKTLGLPGHTSLLCISCKTPFRLEQARSAPSESPEADLASSMPPPMESMIPGTPMIPPSYFEAETQLPQRTQEFTEEIVAAIKPRGIGIPPDIREVLDVEDVIFANHPSASAKWLNLVWLGLWMSPVFVGWLVALVLAIFSGSMVGILLVTLGLFFALVPFYALHLYWQNTFYILTRDKIVVRGGVFNRTIKIAWIKNIQEISINSGVVDRWLNLNTIHFATASNSGWIAGWIVGGILFRYVELKQVLRALKSVDL